MQNLYWRSSNFFPYLIVDHNIYPALRVIISFRKTGYMTRIVSYKFRINSTWRNEYLLQRHLFTITGLITEQKKKLHKNSLPTFKRQKEMFIKLHEEFWKSSGLLCWKDKCLLYWHIGNSKHLKALSELHINTNHFTHL